MLIAKPNANARYYATGRTPSTRRPRETASFKAIASVQSEHNSLHVTCGVAFRDKLFLFSSEAHKTFVGRLIYNVTASYPGTQ